MTYFKQKPGTKSAVRHMKQPFPDVLAFEAIMRSLFLNPLACTSYMTGRKTHLPVEKVRERYTAKFVYEDAKGKQVGNGSDVYDSVEGFLLGIASITCNMSNLVAHRGKIRHLPFSDLFSVTLKCHDPNGEINFLSLARNRFTVSSYRDETILKRVENWAERVPLLDSVKTHELRKNAPKVSTPI